MALMKQLYSETVFPKFKEYIENLFGFANSYAAGDAENDLSMLNAAGNKKKKTGTLFATQKDGVHGFGLRRAEAILKEHGGWVKYNSEDAAFTSEFLVPVIN